MNPTIISLIRHGETDVNREPIFQGQMNNPLAIEGTRQAVLLAARLSHLKFDVLYSSDLLRAVQTAAILGKPHDKEIRTSSQLREINRGDWTGMSYKACAAADPAGWKASRINPEFRSPGGESFVDLHKRIVAEIDRIARLHPGMHIMIVTHGGPIRAFLRHAIGLPAHHMQPFEAANTSISRFKLEDQQWTMQLFNDCAHLEINRIEP
ncbi:probable phosphoglycerate mutase [Paenibacillus sp. 1_12]|uniref:histidine phosphatase family protein n=1 Tax=Paenibacillus sp. 1_12 TaxID=1566278 RepID=UPI0008E8ECA8|nr:histidine phosphatase family protein [Paenibacillus sp. 1_12]SFK74330.1 probable phosphoglycerate mutase [Paenibacillus sp. 1_12]